MLTILVSVIAGLVLLAIILKIAFPLPSHKGDPKELALPVVASPIEEAASGGVTAHPGQTGLHLLGTGIDAFAMRLAMVQNATRSIDAQYYIWEGDLSGKMLLSEIIKAADRGVRVRLLIDDNPTAGLDPMWAAVTTHPNILVKIFNPLVIRKVRALNYLFDFPRLNRRMHNKSITVDGASTVIGGRNVGDEYFGAKTEGLFIDLDTLAIGPAVNLVSNDFERYWTSEPAFPAELILSAAAPDAINTLRNPNYEDADTARDYRAAAVAAVEKLRFDASDAMFVWAPVELVSDNPEKALDKAARTDLLAYKIAPLFLGAKKRVDLISGYFVPGKDATAMFADLAQKGVDERIVTNSFSVTDVPVVHAGYEPYRPDLVKAGVKLYEAQPTDINDTKDHDLGQTRFSGGGESVHAKTFAIDEKTMFIGSFNFDPRSALLNCEMGFIIDSPYLATLFNERLSQRVDEYSYRVEEDKEGKLTWRYETKGKVTYYQPEPGTTGLDRAMVRVMGWLPIEWLL